MVPTPRKICAALVFFVGFGLLTVLLSSLMGYHLFALPGEYTVGTEQGHPHRVIHILAGGCPCSEEVVEQLLERGVRPEGGEYFIRLGETAKWEHKLLDVGFMEMVISGGEEMLEGLSSAPGLMIISEDNQILYHGGYASLRPGPTRKEESISIVAKLAAGDRVSPYPILGCSVSEKPPSWDPLNIKKNLSW